VRPPHKHRSQECAQKSPFGKDRRLQQQTECSSQRTQRLQHTQACCGRCWHDTFPPHALGAGQEARSATEREPEAVCSQFMINWTPEEPEKLRQAPSAFVLTQDACHAGSTPWVVPAARSSARVVAQRSVSLTWGRKPGSAAAWVLQGPILLRLNVKDRNDGRALQLVFMLECLLRCWPRSMLHAAQGQRRCMRSGLPRKGQCACLHSTLPPCLLHIFWSRRGLHVPEGV